MQRILVCVILFSSHHHIWGNEEQSKSPNIIVIFCDDMGYADIGPFGAKGYTTPNLERMAKEGCKLTSFYVGRSVCSPSRAALLTGCYPVRVGVPNNFGPSSKTGLNPKEVTIADMLKDKGYATACFGKWHLGHQKKFLPTNQGFDEYFGLPYSNDMWPYHPEQNKRFKFPDLPLMEGTKVINPKVMPKDQPYLTKWYAERTVKFIEKNRNKPFFIYLPHAMPHVPIYASERFKGSTKWGLYGDVIREIDWSVGQILDTLRKQKLDKKTLVIFTSDNGPWLAYGNHAGSAGPLREGKGTAFEGGYRVPCVAWWPGKIPANTQSDEFASTIDILPTVAHLTDAELPEQRIDGKNIWPLLSGKKNAKTPHEAFFYYQGKFLAGVRSGKWKLMFAQSYRHPDPVGKDGQPGKRNSWKMPLSLFNLETDVGEKHNVASEHPEVVKRLQKLAVDMRKKLGDRNRKGSEERPVGR